MQIRSAESKLKKLFALERNFTIEERPLHKKLVCNCWDFSLLLCAFLRYQGIPARARCGFATYFIKDKYEDHWVCEYWQSKAQRWVMVDAQLDEFQQQVLQIDFDPFNVPLGKFIPAGQAWQMCRRHRADPHKFGIYQYRGLMFILGDLQRDLLALIKSNCLLGICGEFSRNASNYFQGMNFN